jgi:hypothetical protein
MENVVSDGEAVKTCEAGFERISEQPGCEGVELDGSAVINGVGSDGEAVKTHEVSFERVSEQLGCEGDTVSTENQAISGENVVSKESADISNEEPKSQLENFVDNLDRDFTDDTSASLSEQEEEFDDESDEAEDEDDGEISFADLGLDETILAAIEKKRF